MNAPDFICRAKVLGFTLDQIAEILEIRRAGSAPCGCVKHIVERNLGELSRLRRVLKALATSAAPSSSVEKVCPIIEAAR